jgi:hypothetical protein
MNSRGKLKLDRRQFLHGAAGLAIVRSRAGPTARILETKIISHQASYYHGWPTLARCRNGRLLLAYSGGREAHVCPFGRVELMVSKDDGKTWGWPQVLLDSAIDDRDAGIVETSSGSILVTTFTSLAYEPLLEAALKKKPGEEGSWDSERLAAWRAAHERLDDQQRKSALGQWAIRTTDGGLTWSTRKGTIVNSPHGPSQLSDGRLIYVGKELWTGRRRVGCCESRDDGANWSWLSDIHPRPGDSIENYHELHAVESADGRIIAHIRNHNPANNHETLQTESEDGGKSWSLPHSIGIWGLPSFLLRLRDGILVMTYGYRRLPYGNQARLSQDNGRTWSEALVVSADGFSTDLGYPSTVELGDGSLLTVWYERMKDTPRAVLRQAHWRVELS